MSAAWLGEVPRLLEEWDISVYGDEVVHLHTPSIGVDRLKMISEYPFVEGFFISTHCGDNCTYVVAGPFPDFATAISVWRLMQ